MKIFDSLDYKAYTVGSLKSRPKGGRGQFRRLAEFLSINSTMVSQILSGSKDFTLEQAQQTCEFLGLTPLEKDYFMMLVQIERAGSFSLKEYYREKLKQIKKESLQVSKRVAAHRKLTDLEKSVFYSSPIYAAVHLLTTIGRGITLDDILRKLNLSRPRGLEILQFLTSIGLVTQENNLYRPGHLATHLDRGSPFLSKHHTNWRIKAIEKFESLTDEELMFTANISLSRSDFDLIKKKLLETIQDISKVVKNSPAEDVANLNIDLFWMGRM